MERAEAGGSRAAPGAPLADRGETVERSYFIAERLRGGVSAGRSTFEILSKFDCSSL